MLGRLIASALLLSLMIDKYTKVEPQKQVYVSSKSDLRMIVSPLKIRTLKHSVPALIETLHLISSAQTHLDITVKTITRRKVSHANI